VAPRLPGKPWQEPPRPQMHWSATQFRGPVLPRLSRLPVVPPSPDLGGQIADGSEDGDAAASLPAPTDRNDDSQEEQHAEDQHASLPALAGLLDGNDCWLRRWSHLASQTIDLRRQGEWDVSPTNRVAASRAGCRAIGHLSTTLHAINQSHTFWESAGGC
jgi:hypothetical protein